MTDVTIDEATPNFSFQELIAFLDSALAFVKAIVELARVHSVLSASLTSLLAPLPNRIDIHIDAVRGHIEQLPTLPIDYFIGLDPANMSDGVRDIQYLVQHGLQDGNPEMAFKTGVYNESLERISRSYGDITTTEPTMSLKEWRQFFGQSVDTIKSLGIILKSIAAAIPLIGGALSEIVDAIQNALEQDERETRRGRQGGALSLARRAFAGLANALRIRRDPVNP